jgi:hypothetical protein
MPRQSNPRDYSHTALLTDVTRDENNKIVNTSAPYGSVDIANNGEVLGIRKWDNAKAKAKATSKKTEAA